MINQLATPGLGSLMGRRYIAGGGQLTLALAGFVLVLIWMLFFFYELGRRQMGESPPEYAYGWMGKWGAISFIAGWAWSLVTSASLLWRAYRAPAAEGDAIPPRITG